MYRDKFKHDRVYHASQKGTKSIQDLLTQFTQGSLVKDDVKNGSIDLPSGMPAIPLEQDLSDLCRIRNENKAKIAALNRERNKKLKEQQDAINARLQEYDSLKAENEKLKAEKATV